MGILLETVQGEHWTPGRGHLRGVWWLCSNAAILSSCVFTVVIWSLHFLGRTHFQGPVVTSAWLILGEHQEQKLMPHHSLPLTLKKKEKYLQKSVQNNLFAGMLLERQTHDPGKNLVLFLLYSQAWDAEKGYLLLGRWKDEIKDPWNKLKMKLGIWWELCSLPSTEEMLLQDIIGWMPMDISIFT